MTDRLLAELLRLVEDREVRLAWQPRVHLELVDAGRADVLRIARHEQREVRRARVRDLAVRVLELQQTRAIS